MLESLVQLKLPGRDHRLRQTDTANRRAVLRIMQSIPSPYAEPFKEWLAQVGDERIAEIEQPDLVVEQMRDAYRRQGYADAWIEQRVRTDMIRNELTDAWKARGATEGVVFAVLTNEINAGTFGLSVQAHRNYKLLPKAANLRDHMTTLELALISLGEATTTELHRTRDSTHITALTQDARDGGAIAGNARREIEAATGRPAVAATNHLAQIADAKAKHKHLPSSPPPDAPEQQTFFADADMHDND